MDMGWMEVLLNPPVLDVSILCEVYRALKVAQVEKWGVVPVVTQKAEMESELLKTTNTFQQIGRVC